MLFVAVADGELVPAQAAAVEAAQILECGDAGLNSMNPGAVVLARVAVK